MTVPFADWVSREGEPALPSDYTVALGTKPYDYAAHWGVTGAAAKNAYETAYGKPVYTYKDLDSLFGKPPSIVFPVHDLLYKMGYLTKANASRPFYTDESRNALRKAMADANKNGLTLDQMYQTMISGGKLKYGPQGSDTSSSGSGSGSGGRYVSTSTSTSLTSREAAAQVLASSLTQQLGRQPTAAEISQFQKALNATEKANPSRSTTVSQGSHSSTTSTSTNVSPSAEADAWAKGNKGLTGERQGYQGALYYDVIAQMLGG